MSKPWRALVVATAAGAGALICLALPVLFGIPVDAHCTYLDINIKTGQARTTRQLWYTTVSERITETSISRAMQGQAVNAAPVAPWHRVRTYPGQNSVSPHRRYHRAIVQTLLLGGVFDQQQLTIDERRALAEQVLRAWQVDGDDSTAGDIIEKAMTP